jgi:EmrB/QacA subfamily drug resistance transporter
MAAGTLRVDSTIGRGALATTILASGMVFLDGTIANVATRRIGVEFKASFASLQWVLNGYTLALASLILLGGSLGDRFGRRRVYMLGILWFASASLLCAIAPNAGVLIAARVLQGIGGALLTPGSLALIQASFAPSDTARAVGIWSGMSGVSTAVGPLLGGYLVQHVSWRWAFGINVPFAVAAVYLGLRYVPESKSEEHHAGRLDLIGTVLITLCLASLTYGTTLAGGGWGATASSITLAGLVLLGVFVLVESRLPDPMLPPRLFTNRVFDGANVMTFMTYGALSAVLFLFVLNLQVAGHYGALAAGLATLPITILLLLLSPRAGALSAKIGPRLPLTVGPLLAAVGIALTARIDEHHHNYLIDVLPGIAVFGLGLACLVAPLTATVMSAADENDVGIASGVNNAVARSASLLAVAVIPPLAGLTGEKYQQPAAMAHSYRLTVAICIVILIVGAIAVLLTVPSRRPVPEVISDDAGN